MMSLYCSLSISRFIKYGLRTLLAISAILSRSKEDEQGRDEAGFIGSCLILSTIDASSVDGLFDCLDSFDSGWLIVLFRVDTICVGRLGSFSFVATSVENGSVLILLAKVGDELLFINADDELGFGAEVDCLGSLAVERVSALILYDELDLGAEVDILGSILCLAVGWVSVLIFFMFNDVEDELFDFLNSFSLFTGKLLLDCNRGAFGSVSIRDKINNYNILK